MGMLQRGRDAVARPCSQLPGHSKTPPKPQHCSDVRPSAPSTCKLRRGIIQEPAPHCAPGGQVPALLQVQSSS